LLLAEPEPSQQDIWRDILTGDSRGLRTTRRLLGSLPSEPRCKLCAAPFGRPGSLLLRPLGFGPSQLNRRFCRGCFRKLDRYPGGTELELTLLFADVRGSTGLAERIGAQEFSRLLARFYGAAAKVIDGRDGIVDKFVGDEVVALFVPGIAGADHAADAIEAAKELLSATGHGDGEPWIPVGAGVHTGVAYVGAVGEGDALDFTALGDPVNATARLASCAATGQILVSEEAATAAAFDTDSLEAQIFELKGRVEPIRAWVVTAEAAPA
jgi:adenylate cyclase